MSDEPELEDEIINVERLCGHISEVKFEKGISQEEKQRIIKEEIEATVCEHCEAKQGKA